MEVDAVSCTSTGADAHNLEEDADDAVYIIEITDAIEASYYIVAATPFCCKTSDAESGDAD